MLCMMYYRTANIQTVYAGRTSASSAQATGSCDGVSGLNGWNTSTGCVKMLGVENPYGNINKWVDGICFSSLFQTKIFVHRKPIQYVDDTTNSITLSFSRPTSDGYVKTLKVKDERSERSYPYCSSEMGKVTTYYGDAYYYSSSGSVLYVGGRWDNKSNAGLWFLSGFLNQ